jgi:hypothetical protein
VVICERSEAIQHNGSASIHSALTTIRRKPPCGVKAGRTTGLSEESVAGFFVHCAAIAGLYMLLTYYTMKWLRHRKLGTRSIASIAENIHE